MLKLDHCQVMKHDLDSTRRPSRQAFSGDGSSPVQDQVIYRDFSRRCPMSREWRESSIEIADLKNIIEDESSDNDMKDLASEELSVLEEKILKVVLSKIK